MHSSTFRFAFLVSVIVGLIAARSGLAAEKLSFNRDIRPILSDRCFACHGPDKNHRKADLRLDIRDEALAGKAFSPGKPEVSELVKRIFSADPEQLMPPVEANKPLTAEQKELLKRWVIEGAEYEGHWAYQAPQRPAVPARAAAIDHLVEQRLTKLGLKPSAVADRRTLARRLAFDLVGLPPQPSDVEAFVNDASPEAYRKLVEKLLASPHYGERMAIGWLDVVRFADTAGYHSDNARNVYPYRDYVIRAFNENKPFDRFTVEQLAGDLLPGSTLEQKVGSSFNRQLLTTEEGGAQAKDYEARYMGDRVRAVGTVWLGQTIGCAQCHDHKFDPSTARDFYSMGAFFADIQETIIGGREPGILVISPEQQAKLTELQAAATELQKQFDAPRPELADAFAKWQAALTADPANAQKAPALPKEIVAVLAIPADKRDAAQTGKLLAHFKSVAPELTELRTQRDAAKKAATDFEAAFPKCIVSVSMATPRTVRILPRGNWLDETGPIMEPALPAYLSGSMPKLDRRLNRLDLANWIVSRGNPLTARVFVNRLWKQFFGSGLSKTVEDFGAQGEPPVNPALLDWLAVEFVESGWDIKHLVRLMVSSRTYQQVSTASKEMLLRDPENRELARQSRFRLDAELVRDNALTISGLLVPTIGGPSVKPYQPDGYWENLNFPTRTWAADQSANQYRRGLYTWWQRSFVHPSMLAFDAPTREECAADRPRSNIPQQALVLLNDPSYVEAARAFAVRIVQGGGPDTASRLKFAYQQALARQPRPEEVASLTKLIDKLAAQYATDAKSADAILKVGIAPPPSGMNPADLAVWTNIARVILNLHETVVRS